MHYYKDRNFKIKIVKTLIIISMNKILNLIQISVFL